MNTRAKTHTPPGNRHAFRLGAVAASLLVGIALAGCEKAEAPTTPATAAQPPSSSSTPSGAPTTSTPASADTATPAPASSATTPGTPQGAANSLPPSDSDNTAKATAQGAAKTTEGAVDAKETDPAGNLSKQEEKSSMPEALHGNNHSSPALDGDAKKPNQ